MNVSSVVSDEFLDLEDKLHMCLKSSKRTCSSEWQLSICLFITILESFFKRCPLLNLHRVINVSSLSIGIYFFFFGSDELGIFVILGKFEYCY